MHLQLQRRLMLLISGPPLTGRCPTFKGHVELWPFKVLGQWPQPPAPSGGARAARLSPAVLGRPLAGGAGAAGRAGALPSRERWDVGRGRRRPALEPSTSPPEDVGAHPVPSSAGTRAGRRGGRVRPERAGRGGVGDGVKGHRGHVGWNGSAVPRGSPGGGQIRLRAHLPRLGNGSENLPSSNPPAPSLCAESNKDAHDGPNLSPTD